MSLLAPPRPDARVRVESFGCRLNIAESAQVETMLTAEPGNRRRVVINGCAVTSSAMADARAAARRARRDDPDAEVIVTGCAAQVDPAMFAAMPEVDRVLGNAEKHVAAAYAPAAARVAVGPALAIARTAPQLVPAFSSHARAFLEVQNGCDHACTFCVIPAGRGRSRSVPVEQVVAQARALTAAGHSELVLTGVDLTSYDDAGTRLSGLIAAILEALPSLPRLRLGSIDPAEVDPALFRLLTCEPRVMPHVHLSLQAGDDLVLKRMRRRHSRADAVALCAALRDARPGIAIGADLIAGFPTESEDAAQRTRALVADCGLSSAHVFPYSPRPGTPAARMPQGPTAVVHARARALREAASRAKAGWLAAQLGRDLSLLVERDGRSGHAENFARVRLTDVTEPGTIVSARAIAVDGDTLTAEMRG